VLVFAKFLAGSIKKLTTSTRPFFANLDVLVDRKKEAKGVADQACQ